jgi:hypothetical protein
MGNVAVRETDECAEGAKVVLIMGAKTKVAETVTNNYGDFKFEALAADNGKYTLEIDFPGCAKQKVELSLKKSVNVGTIFV